MHLQKIIIRDRSGGAQSSETRQEAQRSKSTVTVLNEGTIVIKRTAPAVPTSDEEEDDEESRPTPSPPPPPRDPLEVPS